MGVGMVVALVLAAVGIAGDRLSGPVSVVDGDTLTVDGLKVRLQGVDAPEWDQTCWNGDGAAYPCGRRVEQGLEGWLQGREVDCVVIDVDRYGRSVARCFLGTVDIGQALVRAGGALAYVRYSVDYVADEAIARGRLRGVWSGPSDPPDRWRRLSDGEKAARVREVEASLGSDPSGRSITPLR